MRPSYSNRVCCFVIIEHKNKGAYKTMNHLYQSRDIQFLADLSDMLELLSVSLTNPTREFAQALIDGSYFSDLSACITGLSSVLDVASLEQVHAQIAACKAQFAQEDCEALYHQINQEFTRLFVSPRRELMPLYESLLVHRSEKKVSMFINPSCMHAEQEYRKHGFAFPEKGKTPGDHIAIELRYVAFLTSMLIGAQVSDNAQAQQNAKTYLDEFVTAHIQRWYAAFMTELAKTTAHPFYLLVAQVGALLK